MSKSSSLGSTIKNIFMKAVVPSVTVATQTPEQYSAGIMKAYIPEFLYKPPYGYPRKSNLPFLRQLAATPNVFSVVKTLSDESSSLDYKIKMKEDIDNPDQWEEQLKEAQTFFQNPNGNEESWEHIQRALIRDILEIDSGVLVKVFDMNGKMKQIYARDGATFLKNPDIHGYIGYRDEIILPLSNFYGDADLPFDGRLDNPMVRQYYQYAIESAAYFQYGWTAGGAPVPFGKREIVYLIANPRADSIYGRSPVEILSDVIQTLYYGTKYNFDFYVNSNIPEGILQMAGVDDEELKAVGDKFHDKFTVRDALDNERRVGHRVPVTSAENVAFIPFTMSPKELMIIEQQQWFSKVLWMCFGVTPDEMGVTDQSNRAISGEQAKVFKRKAIRPICKCLKYHIDTQILPEFVLDKFGGDWDKAMKECPFEFVYDDYDIEEDTKKHNLLQMEINMGVKTPEMAAEELGINVDDLKASKKERMIETQAMMPQGLDADGKPIERGDPNNPDDKDPNRSLSPKEEKERQKEKEKKEEETKSILSTMEERLSSYIKDVSKTLELSATMGV